MPLLPMSTLLSHAREHGYAVGYFESWNLESILAVKDAAEELASPVILGFSGGFIGNPRRRVPENLRHYAALGRAIADASPVPMSLILNEAADADLILQGLEAGFNVVMHGHLRCTLQESVEINRHLTAAAHAMHAEVEAELGELPAASAGSSTAAGGEETDPEEAAWFVGQTGVDALAVSVGNVHMLEGRTASLNLDLLSTLARRVPVPLVLHGGTGIDAGELREAIRIGVAKVNIGTLLRRTFVNSLRRFLLDRDVDRLDVNELTSTGGQEDMLAAARAAVGKEVGRLMKVLGSAGMASRFRTPVRPS